MWGCRIPGKGFDELLCRPLRGRVCGHVEMDVEMDEPPPCVGQHDPHEADRESDRRHGEEVVGERQLVSQRHNLPL